MAAPTALGLPRSRKAAPLLAGAALFLLAAAPTLRRRGLASLRSLDASRVTVEVVCVST